MVSFRGLFVGRLARFPVRWCVPGLGLGRRLPGSLVCGRVGLGLVARCAGRALAGRSLCRFGGRLGVVHNVGFLWVSFALFLVCAGRYTLG